MRGVRAQTLDVLQSVSPKFSWVERKPVVRQFGAVIIAREFKLGPKITVGQRVPDRAPPVMDREIESVVILANSTRRPLCVSQCKIRQ